MQQRFHYFDLFDWKSLLMYKSVWSTVKYFILTTFQEQFENFVCFSVSKRMENWNFNLKTGKCQWIASTQFKRLFRIRTLVIWINGCSLPFRCFRIVLNMSGLSQPLRRICSDWISSLGVKRGVMISFSAVKTAQYQHKSSKFNLDRVCDLKNF